MVRAVKYYAATVFRAKAQSFVAWEACRAVSLLVCGRAARSQDLFKKLSMDRATVWVSYMDRAALVHAMMALLEVPLNCDAWMECWKVNYLYAQLRFVHWKA